MIEWLRWTIVGASLLLAVLAYVDFRRGNPPRRPTIVVAAIVQVTVVVQVIAAVVALVSGTRPGELATFIGYLFTVLLIVPAAWYFRVVEPTKWASMAMLVASVTNAVLVVRLEQLWQS